MKIYKYNSSMHAINAYVRTADLFPNHSLSSYKGLDKRASGREELIRLKGAPYLKKEIKTIYWSECK